MADKKQTDLETVLARLGALEVELASAREGLAAAREEAATARGDLAAMKEELARKDQIIAWLQKKMFGKSSERLDPNQLDLDFDDAVLGKPEPLPETGDTGAAPEEGAAAKTKKRRRTKAELLPRNLPIVIDAVIIPEAVASDPDAFKEIDEEHQDSLDITPASMFWRRKTCKKYVRIDDPADLDEAIKEMLAYDGPVIFDCRVEKHENCFPMIPSGKPHNEMLLGDADTAGAIGAKGAVLV